MQHDEPFIRCVEDQKPLRSKIQILKIRIITLKI